MQHKKHLPTIMTLLALTVLTAGCGRSGEETATEPAEVPPALTAVFTAVPAAADPATIPELRRSARPGAKVVFEAKVMGSKAPFVDERAAFVVGDESVLTSCDLLHADGCSTPWDTCCDDPGDLRTGTATIQVVDESGQVLRHGIRGVSGLKELSRLRIEGVVAPNASETAFIVNASKIQLL